MSAIVFARVLLAITTIVATGKIQVYKSGGTQQTDASGAVIWLTPIDDFIENGSNVSRQHLQLLQRNKTFSPHVLVVPVGASVEFPNRDPFFHNVFSLFDGKRFDLGLYEAGTSRSVIFNREGISYIFCNIHPEMSAVVIALKTPYYAISDRKGFVSIPDVPPGHYEMRIWHERVLTETLGHLTRSIVISDKSNSLGVIQLTEQRALSEKHPNKYGHDYDPSLPNIPPYGRTRMP
jgi:plastocyanin